jgi:hypothetical protein
LVATSAISTSAPTHSVIADSVNSPPAADHTLRNTLIALGLLALLFVIVAGAYIGYRIRRGRTNGKFFTFFACCATPFSRKEKDYPFQPTPPLYDFENGMSARVDVDEKSRWTKTQSHADPAFGNGPGRQWGKVSAMTAGFMASVKKPKFMRRDSDVIEIIPPRWAGNNTMPVPSESVPPPPPAKVGLPPGIKSPEQQQYEPYEQYQYQYQPQRGTRDFSQRQSQLSFGTRPRSVTQSSKDRLSVTSSEAAVIENHRRQSTRYSQAISVESAPRFRTVISWVNHQTNRIYKAPARPEDEDEVPIIPARYRRQSKPMSEVSDNSLPSALLHHPGVRVPVPNGSVVASEELDAALVRSASRGTGLSNGKRGPWDR